MLFCDDKVMISYSILKNPYLKMKSSKTALKISNLTGHFKYSFFKRKDIYIRSISDASSNNEKNFIFNQML